MGTTAFVFPGQGSQSIGMLSELADNYPHITHTFNQVSERLGYDVWNLIQNGPEGLLNNTERTQVAMLTADVAIYQIMQQECNIVPFMMAGHSLGEYAALVCANALSLEDAAALVAKRGQLMQENVPFGEGAMAAIVGLDDEQVQELCLSAASATELVSPANYNAIGQVVIAGHAPAVDRAILLADQKGARMAKIIPVSVPCHCSLLMKAAQLFESNLEEVQWSIPSIPVISNVDLSAYQSVSQITSLLSKQLYSPVRWVETIKQMKLKKVEQIIECGPGKVLSGLIKRIDRSLRCISVNDVESLNQAKSWLL